MLALLMELYMKQVFQAIIISLFLTGCVKLPPAERVASWDDWELCQRLAGYVFSGNSQWLWYSVEEISNRELQNDAKCKTVYDSRMSVLDRKSKKGLISITFSDTMNGSSNFDTTVKE